MVPEAKPKPVKKVPAAQLWHVAAAVAPNVVEYRPAAHCVQAKPKSVKKVPAAQF